MSIAWYTKTLKAFWTPGMDAPFSIKDASPISTPPSSSIVLLRSEIFVLRQARSAGSREDIDWYVSGNNTWVNSLTWPVCSQNTVSSKLFFGILASTRPVVRCHWCFSSAAIQSGWFLTALKGCSPKFVRKDVQSGPENTQCWSLSAVVVGAARRQTIHRKQNKKYCFVVMY